MNMKNKPYATFFQGKKRMPEIPAHDASTGSSPKEGHSDRGTKRTATVHATGLCFKPVEVFVVQQGKNPFTVPQPQSVQSFW